MQVNLAFTLSSYYLEQLKSAFAFMVFASGLAPLKLQHHLTANNLQTSLDRGRRAFSLLLRGRETDGGQFSLSTRRLLAW